MATSVKSKGHAELRTFNTLTPCGIARSKTRTSASFYSVRLGPPLLWLSRLHLDAPFVMWPGQTARWFKSHPWLFSITTRAHFTGKLPCCPLPIVMCCFFTIDSLCAANTGSNDYFQHHRWGRQGKWRVGCKSKSKGSAVMVSGWVSLALGFHFYELHEHASKVIVHRCVC